MVDERSPSQDDVREARPNIRPQPRSGHIPLRAVLFDLFHTLVDMRHVPQMTSTADLLGIDPREWSRVVVESSPHHALGTVKDPVESVRIIAHAIDPTIPEERIREAARQRPQRFRAALVEVQPEILAALEAIRATGLPMALISNAGLDEIEAWNQSPLAAFFEAAFFSCHEGVMKPDVEIYQRAARRLGVDAQNCLFVGDGGSREHEGARQARMRTLLFLPMLAHSYPEIAEQRPRNTDWIIEQVDELPALIRQLRTGGMPPMPALA
ncbi:MAG: HAD-IA family hydrolase [Candidatus Eisenbacteria bacterium]|nr:HAD-IA family hydrolase [Candidatus Eisenbacteria bacterium]